MTGIFKKIKLLRKGFLTKYFKLHYSQFGEDITLKELLKDNLNNGFYVDVGCFHPKKHSNTFFLYKRGWRGINIDLEHEKIYLFKLLRPKDENIVAAIAMEEKEVTARIFNDYGLGTTLNPDLIKDQEVIKEIKLKSKTLTSVISETRYKNRQIDILSIDAEGMDFEVLKSLNMEIYKPKIVLVESHENKIENILKSDLYIFMCKNGYFLRSWNFYTLIFVVNNCNITKIRDRN